MEVTPFPTSESLPEAPHLFTGADTGENPLVHLCGCAPPYSQDDTVLAGR